MVLRTKVMNGYWNRRQFFNSAAASAGALALPSAGRNALGRVVTSPGLQGRFLTHVSVLRVNQIEVTPTRSIGLDEVADNHPDRIRGRREAFARGDRKSTRLNSSHLGISYA